MNREPHAKGAKIATDKRQNLCDLRALCVRQSGLAALPQRESVRLADVSICG